jgi:hypothetical protein
MRWTPTSRKQTGGCGLHDNDESIARPFRCAINDAMNAVRAPVLHFPFV